MKRIFTYPAISFKQTGEVHALICIIKRTALLILFAEHEIIYHQKWDADAENELLVSIKSRIQIFTAAFPNKTIQRLAFYSHHQQLNEIIKASIHDWSFEIVFPQPFLAIILSPHLKLSINTENISDFLIACGSVMREVPKW